MNIVSTFLKKRRENRLKNYFKHYQYYCNLYQLEKMHIHLYEKHSTISINNNSYLPSIKEESEYYLKQSRYWLKKFNTFKKTFNSLYN